MASTTIDNFHNFVKTKINTNEPIKEASELMNLAYHQLVSLNDKIKKTDNNDAEREKLIDSAVELASIAFMIANSK